MLWDVGMACSKGQRGSVKASATGHWQQLCEYTYQSQCGFLAFSVFRDILLSVICDHTGNKPKA